MTGKNFLIELLKSIGCIDFASRIIFVLAMPNDTFDQAIKKLPKKRHDYFLLTQDIMNDKKKSEEFIQSLLMNENAEEMNKKFQETNENVEVPSFSLDYERIILAMTILSVAMLNKKPREDLA